MGGGLTPKSVKGRSDVAEEEDNGDNPDGEAHFPVEAGGAAERGV